MKFAEYLRSDDQHLACLLKQAGIDYGVLRCPEKGDGSMVYDYLTLARLKKSFQGLGVNIQVLEPLPNDLHEPIKQGLSNRDACIEKLHEVIRSMAILDIPILCYNFMASVGWTRTSTTVETRGGALVTEYDDSILHLAPDSAQSPLTHDILWKNYQYFLDAVLPVAEENGITLALHPDDPPLPYVCGVPRIFNQVGAFEKALSLSNSPAHRLTFCQGNFRLMGCSVSEGIQRFADKIAFIHFRDVNGNAEKFVETFHDDGPTDMAAAMEAYLTAGLDVPMRSDHVPTMHGEKNLRPGYETLGRLFAAGYMKGLYHAAINKF